MPANPAQKGAGNAAASKVETVNPFTFSPAPETGNWPPTMDDLDFDGKWSLVAGNGTTVTQMTNVYDHVKTAAGGTDNWWGCRMGLDWNAHESVGGGTYNRDSGASSTTAKYDYMLSIGKKVHITAGFTSRSHQRKIPFKAKIHNGTAYSDNAIPGKPDDACCYLDITSFNGVAGAGPQSATTNGGLHCVGPGMPEIAGSPPDADRIVDQVGNKVYPDRALSGFDETVIRDYVLGGYSDPDPKLETDEPEAYGDYIDWILSSAGYPNISSISVANEWNHRMGTMPFLDMGMQFRRLCHGYTAGKLRKPSVYIGTGSTAGTRGNVGGTYLGAYDWHVAFMAFCRQATNKTYWQALRDTLPAATKSKTSDTYPFDFVDWHPYDQGRSSSTPPRPYRDPTDPVPHANTHADYTYFQEMRDWYVAAIALDPALTGLSILCDELNCWFTNEAVTGVGGGSIGSAGAARQNASLEEAYIHLFRHLQVALHPHYWFLTPGWPGGRHQIKQCTYFVIKDPNLDNNHGLFTSTGVRRQDQGTEARSSTNDGVAPLNSGVYGINETHAIHTTISSPTITADTAFPFSFMVGKRITATGISADTFLGKKVSTTEFELSSSRTAHVPKNATATSATTVTATVRKMGVGNDQWDALKYAE